MKKGLSLLFVLGLMASLTCCQEATQPPAGETSQAPAGPTGEAIFALYCASCHGDDAEGGALGPTLVSAEVAAQDDASFQEAIARGRSGTSMPAWDGLLDAQQIGDVIAFLRSKQ